jgi:hypothetical protein
MTTMRFPAFKRGTGVPIDITVAFTSGSIADSLVTFMVKRRHEDTDAQALLTLNNALLGGVTIVQPNAPSALIRITPTAAQMAALPAKTLVAGIQIEPQVGDLEELDIDPTFIVRADVVRRVPT